MTIVDRRKLLSAYEVERERFVALHPASRAASLESGNLLGGVPMAWMSRWAGDFPIVFAEAHGAGFTDIDGNRYVDFCLGDTGAMVGHGLEQIADALYAQALRGITTMLPSQDAAWVAGELAARFGCAKWQMAMTATDANRFVLRFARHLTNRPKVLVFDWCYHGTVDEAFATLDAEGAVVKRPGTIGTPVPLDQTTRVVQFNDLDALEQALAHGDVAAVLAEPALTNIGIVLPDEGYHRGLRDLCTKYGTILIIDETHTICAGPGGATKAWGLEPDMVVIGKTIGGGMPVAAYGMTESLAAQLEPTFSDPSVDTSGVGGTLTGNALALAAVRATLSTTLLQADFDRMIPLATSWTAGVAETIDRHELEWCVNQLGCRAEYWFCPPPRNGRDAAASVDNELDVYLHLFAINEGVLMTPFHNMALISPSHTQADVDRHTEVFAAAVAGII
ncbi:MAG TPA: aspartate aminotransferase family protein [Acidimicrobiaceae bacterium]|jgi:glutamate-1-semialdehyde 2,1-aminomutase|nr:aspartate aminotransferase family protein [Acidimicrobiaceae bacterium]